MQTQPDALPAEGKLFRILSLDGGGAKGFYTLGILDEIEKNLQKPLAECFELIFGTSTGAIIATLLSRGESMESILALYSKHVPAIMKPEHPSQRTGALHQLGNSVFAKTAVDDLKTPIGIVATNWKDKRPFIFKKSPKQAHGSIGSFKPFFGCAPADAVIASCSAYPFFETCTLDTSKGQIELGDGGFCANNPTLYAIADATQALNVPQECIRVVSIGVGSYPKPSIWKKARRIRGGWALVRHSLNSDFLQQILDTNTGSMDQLREILFRNVPTIRISESFVEPELATDLLEHDLTKLNRLTQKGRISYQKNESRILEFLQG